MPVRTCVGCRRKTDQADLVRYAIVSGEIVADEAGTMPGRGAYVCRGDECFEKAMKTGALKRALKIRNARED